MPIPDEFFDRLRQSCEITSIMTSYVQLKRAGRDFVCLCPFHSEKTASCHVYSDTQSFYCFGCGAGGDVITFVRLIENLDYMEGVRYLAEKVGLTIPDNNTNSETADQKTHILEINRMAARFYRDMLLSPEGRAGLDYLLDRGLTPNTIKKYGLGYAPNEWEKLKMHLRNQGKSDDEMVLASLAVRGKNGSVYDKFRHRVMFPIIDRRGNVIGFSGRVLDSSQEPKYLNSSETLVFKKRDNLFSLNFAKNSKEKYMLLCEGNMDVIALNQAGWENSVATLGTAITPEQARLLHTYCEEVVIAYDADNAGQKATMKAINLLSDAGLAARVLRMDGSSGYGSAKDPDEFLQKYGREAFQELIEKSGSAISYELYKIRSALDTDTTEGRAEYLKKAVVILAGIENKLDRSVYISDTAKICEVSIQTVELHVSERIKSIAKRVGYDEKKKLINGTVRNSNKPSQSTQGMKEGTFILYADEQPHRKEAGAERGVIAYIFHSPDKLSHIMSRLSPNDFPNDFNRKLLELLVLRLMKGLSIDIQSMGSEFSTAEMGRIEGIIQQSRLLPFTQDRLDNYIQILCDFKRFKHKKSPVEMTSEELRELQEELSKRKRGKV